eukprot:8036629-Alexandrium_andersonii.AAC.1
MAILKEKGGGSSKGPKNGIVESACESWAMRPMKSNGLLQMEDCELLRDALQVPSLPAGGHQI